MSIALWICSASAVFALGDAESDGKRARAIVEREKVQTKLEHGELYDDAAASAFDSPRFNRLFSFSLSAPSLAGLGTMLLYVGVAAVVVVALLAAARSIQRRRAGLATATPRSLRAAGSEQIEGNADELFAEADRLAEEGRWDEAVHALLLAAIRGLSDEFGPPRRSRTSRELLAHFRLEGGRLSAFRRLVAAVERVVFGEQATDEALFRDCRELAVDVRRTGA